MHPHTVHALAAATALRAALVALEAHAKEAVDDAIAGDRSHGDVPIPSQVFGRRHALGGHGDPTALHALSRWRPWRAAPEGELLADVMRELDHAAQHLPGAPGQDPLDRITRAIPQMRPDTAARTAEALTHLDRSVRDRFAMPPDLVSVTGQCPACRSRGVLYVTSGRLLVCRATGCVCAGDGCPCGMPVRVEGVAHIWPPCSLSLLSPERPDLREWIP